MRQLLPTPVADVDPYDAYRPANPHQPLLRLNMVSSLDGHATDADGVTAGLGGPGDFSVFVTLRALADAILVGANTARIEDYGPHRLRPALGERRRADGRAAPAPIVVVSRSLALEPSARLFAEATTRPIVLTCAQAPAARRRTLEPVADLVTAGDDRVDLAQGLAALRERGLAHVLCEGGPTINGELVAAGLVNELCLTLAPQLAGGAGPPIAAGLPAAVELDLLGLLTDGRDLFARYGLAR